MCDPCVYVKNDSSSKVFSVLYVVDLLVTGSSEVGSVHLDRSSNDRFM